MTSRSSHRHEADEQKGRRTDAGEPDEFEFFHEFSRENVRIIIHLITEELKTNGINIEFLMIPFRKEQSNESLLKFLNKLFPMGQGKKISETKTIRKIITQTDPFTLFQALKYIWCRLPNGEVIGWKPYLEFKQREKYLDFPQKAFLEIMPKCLSSSNHASIVYDFFDLIVTLASNSKINKMSARKFSKMCAVWAFNNKHHPEESQDEDYEIPPFHDNSIQDGLDQWLPASNAMFHLLLAFLKSFLPPQDSKSNDTNSKLPRSLKHLLLDSAYPPVSSSLPFASESILTIPLVTLNTNQFSRKPWHLLERCNKLLDFSDPAKFQAREDYALLKSLFNKKNNVEGISRKMSQESRRIMKLIQTKHSTFQAGWPKRSCVDKNPDVLIEHIQEDRIDIDDYFIWTWLSSISYEQTTEKKRLFGRSLILEFEFDGFKKWVVFQERDIALFPDYRHDDDSEEVEDKEELEHNITIEKSNELPHQSNIATGNKDSDSSYISGKSQQRSISSTSSSSVPSGNGIYHTVISKEALNGNNSSTKSNLQSLEQKFSKWNPLQKLAKKGNNNNFVSPSTIETGSSIAPPETRSSSNYESPVSANANTDAYKQLKPKSSKRNINPYSNESNKNVTTNVPLSAPQKLLSKEAREDRVVSQYSLLNPAKYQLPVIEKEESFKIDLPGLENIDNIHYEPESPTEIPNSYALSHIDESSPELTPDVNLSKTVNDLETRISPNHESNRRSSTMEELRGMVEDMIRQESFDKSKTDLSLNDTNTLDETFESLTKFDQYKPSKIQPNLPYSNNSSKTSFESRPSPSPAPLQVTKPMMSAAPNAPYSYNNSYNRSENFSSPDIPNEQNERSREKYQPHPDRNPNAQQISPNGSTLQVQDSRSRSLSPAKPRTSPSPIRNPYSTPNGCPPNAPQTNFVSPIMNNQQSQMMPMQQQQQHQHHQRPDRTMNNRGSPLQQHANTIAPPVNRVHQSPSPTLHPPPGPTNHPSPTPQQNKFNPPPPPHLYSSPSNPSTARQSPTVNSQPQFAQPRMRNNEQPPPSFNRQPQQGYQNAPLPPSQQAYYHQQQQQHQQYPPQQQQHYPQMGSPQHMSQYNQFPPQPNLNPQPFMPPTIPVQHGNRQGPTKLNPQHQQQMQQKIPNDYGAYNIPDDVTTHSKLHGNIQKNQGRKKLYNNIRNGQFGI